MCYFGCDLSDCCPHLYCGVTLCTHSLCWVCVFVPVRESLCMLWCETHVLTAISSGLPQVSLVYQVESFLCLDKA